MTVAGPARPAAAARLSRLWLHNQVAAVLVIAGIAAALGTGFVGLAANRLVSARPVMLWAASPALLTAAIVLFGAAILVLAARPPCLWLHRTMALAAGLLLLCVLAAAGLAARSLATGAPKVATVSLGAGFWMLFACAALTLIDALRRAEAGAAMQLFAVAAVGGAFAAMAEAGVFDALSLAREYASRRDAFAAAIVRHIVLVAAAVGPALLVGVPLSLAALRRKQLETPLFAVLNLLQTVPSIALFGLLIGPLSALAGALPALGRLGIGGVGPAPAIIALILYALLPVARNTLAGIDGVPAAAVDAARGMGMSRRQIFWQVEVPLASPVLIAGLRIVTVQAIGLAVVAALIGAGGLGSFVFEGLGQYATGLVLLGALPAIAMALAADFGLRLLAGALAGRYAP